MKKIKIPTPIMLYEKLYLANALENTFNKFVNQRFFRRPASDIAFIAMKMADAKAVLWSTINTLFPDTIGKDAEISVHYITYQAPSFETSQVPFTATHPLIEPIVGIKKTKSKK